jgi:hypothetical protein
MKEASILVSLSVYALGIGLAFSIISSSMLKPALSVVAAAAEDVDSSSSSSTDRCGEAKMICSK